MSNPVRVAIFGGHGIASVIAQAIIHASKTNSTGLSFAGFVNDAGHGAVIDGQPVLGTLRDTPRLMDEGLHFIYAIYKIGGMRERIQWFNDLAIPRDRLATFVHPQAYVAPNAVVAAGCVVMPGASVSANTTIGVGTLLMNGVAIGHDNAVGAHNFYAARSCIGSWINTGEGVWLGLNATVRGRTKLGARSAVGAGAVVTKDIGEDELWVGNPARFHKLVSDPIKF